MAYLTLRTKAKRAADERPVSRRNLFAPVIAQTPAMLSMAAVNARRDVGPLRKCRCVRKATLLAGPCQHRIPFD
jgi:hypothetical protein